MKNTFLGVILLFIFISCSNYISRYSFDYKRIDNSTKQVASESEIYAGYKHYFEDDILKLHLDCDPYRIGFYLINKTDKPLRIMWDSVKVFSEYLNRNVEITHTNKTQMEINIPDSSSSKFSRQKQLAELRKEDSLAVIKPSIVLSTNSYIDEIIPKQDLYWLPYKLSSKDSLFAHSKEVIDSEIKLIFPIKINNEIKNYSFQFIVRDFEILKKG